MPGEATTRHEAARDICLTVAVWTLLVSAVVSFAWVRVEQNHDAAQTAQVVAALRLIGGHDVPSSTSDSDRTFFRRADGDGLRGESLAAGR